MVIYSREEKTIIIPNGFGDSSCGCVQQRCAEEVAEAYQEGYESGLTYGLTSGYSAGYSSGRTDGYEEGYDAGIIADCGEAIEEAYQEGYSSGWTSAANNEKYNITIYCSSQNAPYGASSFKLDNDEVSGNVIDYGLIFWGGNYLLNYTLSLPRIDGGVTELEIVLPIGGGQEGVAPEDISLVRFNGALFVITAQTRELVREEPDAYIAKYYKYHIEGSITDIPPYNFRNFNSAKVRIQGVSALTNDIEFRSVNYKNINVTTNYHCNEESDYIEVMANLKTNRFGGLASKIDNAFIDVGSIVIGISAEDVANWGTYGQDWSVERVWLNGYATTDGQYIGGYKINVDRCILSDNNNLTIHFTWYW